MSLIFSDLANNFLDSFSGLYYNTPSPAPAEIAGAGYCMPSRWKVKSPTSPHSGVPAAHQSRTGAVCVVK